MTTLPFTLPALLPGALDAPADPARRDGSLVPAGESRAEIASLVLAQYQQSPRLQAWIGAFVDRVAALDDVAVSLYEQAFDPERASGVVLDRIARLVGEPTQGGDATALRRRIRVRALVNRSHGTAPELAAIARAHEAIDDPAASVRVYSDEARIVVVVIDATAVSLPSEVYEPISQATEAGVRVQVVTIPAPYARAQAMRLGGSGPGLAMLDGSFGGTLASVLG